MTFILELSECNCMNVGMRVCNKKSEEFIIESCKKKN